VNDSFLFPIRNKIDGVTAWVPNRLRPSALVILIGTEILPGLGCRLYGWKEEERGAGRVRRRTGAMVARRRRWWHREAARVWELRLLRESATNMFIACLNT
jgi:hypothetical protein